MMKKLNDLRAAFKTEGSIRGIVYLAALIDTVVFWTICTMFSHSSSCMHIALIATAIPTSILLYIADGFTAFKAIVNVVSGIAGTIAEIIATLTAFMMGLGFIFGILMRIATVVSVVLGGALFVYAMPVIFVPFLGLVARKLNPSEMKAEKRKDWDHVYAGIRAGVRTDNR